MVTKKITVVTTGGQAVSFHISARDVNEGESVPLLEDLWVETDNLFVFRKLSGNDISFVKSNVVYIDENNAENNADGVTTT
jgi:hypothetical protein